MEAATLLALVKKWEKVGSERVHSDGGDQDDRADFSENCRRDGMLICASDLRSLINLFSA